jgi:hypothetical protein
MPKHSIITQHLEAKSMTCPSLRINYLFLLLYGVQLTWLVLLSSGRSVDVNVDVDMDP